MNKLVSAHKILPFLMLLSFLTLLFFFNRGFLYHDEGYILHSAQRMLDGEKIYKDFHFIFTPGAVFLTTLAFKVFGESIIAGRILMLIISIVTIFIIYRITVKTTAKPLLGILSAFVYLSWGPTHINFPWPVMFALFSGFLTYYFFVIGIQEKNINYSLIAGIITAVTFLFKQNFGVAVLINNVLIFLFVKESKSLRFFIYHILGAVSVFLVFFFYLLITNSLIPFLSDFYLYTIEKILLQGMLNTPFVYGAVWIEKLVKSLFYLIPLIVSSFALLYALIVKSDIRKYFFLSTFCLLFYLFGIRPITDYVHLSPLLALTGIPLVIILGVSQNRTLKMLVYLFSFILIILGFLTGLYKGYYKWETSLAKQDKFLSHPKMNIWLDSKYNIVIPEILATIDKTSEKGDFVFIYYYAPMFYFITDRKNPTMFNDLSPGLLSKEQESEVVRDLKEKEVNTVLAHTSLEQRQNSPIAEYVQTHYQPIKSTYEFTIWRKVR